MMFFSKKITKFIAVCLLVLSLSLVGSNTAKAAATLTEEVPGPSFWAQLGTALKTASLELKEYVLDGLVWTIANMAIESISTSIVRWINSGFEGSPAFVQDLKGHFSQLEGEILGKYLNEIGAGFLCSPFADKIKRSLEIQLAVSQSGGRNAKEALFRKANQCTLDDVLSSLDTTIEQFQDDFSQGGWPAFITMTQSKNNEVGAYLIVRNELFRRQGEATQLSSTELSFGNGFMSWKKKCGAYATVDGQAPRDYNPDAELEGGTPDNYDPDYDPNQAGPNLSGECVDPDAGKIQTPGSVIEKQLNEALGSGQRRLEVADEIDEIVGALFSQLMKQVMGGAGGLLGTSQGSAGRPSYLDQTQNNPTTISSGVSSLSRSIDGSLSQLDGYIAAKQSSVTIVGRLVETLRDWRNCLVAKINAGFPYQSELQSVDAKLAVENPKFAKLTSELEAAVKLKLDLNQLKNSLAQVDQNTELETAYTRYTTLTSSQTSRFNRIDAEQEKDTITNSYPALQSEATAGLNRCELTTALGL